jgi:hypothetical protein
MTRAAAAAAASHISLGLIVLDGEAGEEADGPADPSSACAGALTLPGATACANEAKKSAESFRADPSISRLPSWPSFPPMEALAVYVSLVSPPLS